MQKKLVVLVKEIDHRQGLTTQRYLAKDSSGLYTVCKERDLQTKALTFFSRRLATIAIKDAEKQITQFGAMMREPVEYVFFIEEKIF